jgi:transposase
VVSTKNKRLHQVLELFKSVEKSRVSTKEYFEKHQPAISISQYFRLKKRYQKEGEAGLIDQRHSGNARKVTEEQVNLIRSVLTYNRHLSSADLEDDFESRWGIELSRGRIDQLRRQFDLTRIKPKTSKQEMVQFAGIEIFSALAHYVGIMQQWEETIRQRLEQVRQTERYGDGRGPGDYIYARRRNGTFSPRYNRIARVRQTKFSSVEDKVKDKDFSRLSLYKRRAVNLSRKNLAVLLLPLVTNNGAVRNLDKPLGNALRYACGYNYKNATIDKYLRELKYLQVATELINCNAQFWSWFWRQYDRSDYKLACYYIDGNVKPLWSSKRCRKGKVSMLGRVMGCLEQVIIHDGFGRPIYLRTFSGNADLKHHALQTMAELDELLGEGQKVSGRNSRCSRALIFDSAGNAVKTLRAFSQSPYHYITILDTNQIDDRKFKHLLQPERYLYGDALLTDCRIELIDSTDPGYIHESRSVKIQWDNGKESCLVTSIAQSIFNASQVVKAYFDRWPNGEKQFAMMKAGVCFHQIVGYGKKQVADENMLARIVKLEKDLEQLRNELQIPLSKIRVKDQQIQALVMEERRLKEKSKIKDGRRIQSHRNREALKACQGSIRKMQREIKAIEKPFKKQFAVLQKKSKEFARIQNKRQVYHVDVELDQLLTGFRLTLTNLVAFLAKVILEDTPIEMNTLIQSILFLPGRIEHLPGCRKVYVNRNKKDPEFMAKLEKGFSKLNAFKIRHPSGAIYEFEPF